MCHMVICMNTQGVVFTDPLEILEYLGETPTVYKYKIRMSINKKIISPVYVQKTIHKKYKGFKPENLEWIELYENTKYIHPYGNGYALPIKNAEYIFTKEEMK